MRRLSGNLIAAIGGALLVIAAVAAAYASSSGHGHGTPLPAPRTHRFDLARAYALTRLQVDYGPRPAGSQAERRVAERLVHMLPGGHFERVPGGLRNIVGGLPGRGPAIVLAAHYDTTPVRGYLGANNSATGVAAVIEIAHALAAEPRRSGDAAVRFLLTDGEEAPAGYQDFYSQGLRGSRAYVAAHARGTREIVLLDFIALRDESLPRELGSDPDLWTRLRAAAAAEGTTAMFPDATQGEVLDDHTPFTRAGIPGIDLIDFNYPCWQRDCDTMRQVSRPALRAVGETVLALIDSERRR